MRKLICALVLALGLWSVGAATAGAHHDMVYAPCDPEDTRPLDEQVWYINYETGDALRWDDPFWAEQASPLVSWISNWHFQCRLGMTGVWQAMPQEPLLHPPTHTVESRNAIRATPPTTVVPTTTTCSTPNGTATPLSRQSFS